MKFCRVIVDLVQMNRRRFVVRRDRHIPLSGERSAHVGFDPVQCFFRWRVVKSNRDTVLVNIQPHLLYVRVRFDQPDYSRPRARGSIRALRVWNDLVRHLTIYGRRKASNLSIDCDLLRISCQLARRTRSFAALGQGEYSSGTLPGQPSADAQRIVVVH